MEAGLPGPPQSVNAKRDILFQYHAGMQNARAARDSCFGNCHQVSIWMQQSYSAGLGHPLTSGEMGAAEKSASRRKGRPLWSQGDSGKAGKQLRERDDLRRRLFRPAVDGFQRHCRIDGEFAATRSRQTCEMRSCPESLADGLRQ